MQMMVRTNCPQPRTNAACQPAPAAPMPGPGPVRPEPGCSLSGLSKEQLLCRIATTGFACVDANLYLDTHPEDSEAIAYFEKNNQSYQEALHAYAKAYGPLTLSHAHHLKDYWNWVDQPWPWQ